MSYVFAKMTLNVYLFGVQKNCLIVSFASTIKLTTSNYYEILNCNIIFTTQFNQVE